MSRQAGWRWQVVLLMAMGGTLVGCKSGGRDGSASRQQEHPATSLASGGTATRADAPGVTSAAPASNAKKTTTGAGGGAAYESAASASGGATGPAADAVTTARAAADDALPLDFDLVDKAFQARQLAVSWFSSQVISNAQEFLALYEADATWTVEAAAGGETKTERLAEVAQARLDGDEGRPFGAWPWQPIEQAAAPGTGFTFSTALCFRNAGDSLGCRLVKLDLAPDPQGALRIQHEHWRPTISDEQLAKQVPTLTLSSRLLQLTLLKVPCAFRPRRARREWEYCAMAAFLTADGLRIMSGGAGNYTATDPHDEFVRDDDHTLTWISIGAGKERLRIRRNGARIVFESQFIDLEEPTRVSQWELVFEVRLPHSQPVPIFCATTEERVQRRCLPEVSGI